MTDTTQMRNPTFWSLLAESPILVAGVSILAFWLLVAIFAPFIAPFGPNENLVPMALPGDRTPGGRIMWLGADHLGRDVLSRIMVGAETSIAVGLLAVSIGMAAGVALGAWAAARGGWVDEMLSRTSDLIFAFPAVLIAILIASVLGANARNAVLAIAIFNIPVFARVTRGAALSMWGRDFVRAAIAMGQGPLGITLKHVLPNIASVLIVQATIQFAVAILAEAGLSYLGLGAQPPTPSWGRMLRDAQTYIFQAPELAIWPGLAIALAVLGLNMLGDGLRDLLDPRLRLMRVG